MIKVFFNKSKDKKDLESEIVAKIKKGNDKLRNKFIDDYKPFIVKCIYKNTGKFVEVENSEEYSIGLMAFNEAIDCFDKKRGSFINFAAHVIKRRLINYKLSNKKNNLIYTFTHLESKKTNIENNYSDGESENLLRKFEVKDEIDDFKKKLSEFEITLYDLVKKSPKHKDAISSCIKIARILAENDILYNKLVKRKKLPMLELLKFVNVSKRTIERNRKFIIASCIIIKSDLEVVKGYLENAEKEGG
ncbi:RNA polymerase sigma-I factor [Herbivorax sp. ANBcel31]|uniref:RNA polymerase sigma-I factor n=1 Tax=Herbivorax sp. ANBcel31 TaxID=3069754 RepID=UPI0027B13481|nr:RNA polymerase sigma-I factor [Herbivorax sp. ANBcel31]MDQ2088056.1 RNA polymerase sigma-I factor [Herbivorax sp. ANBcel31]